VQDLAGVNEIGVVMRKVGSVGIWETPNGAAGGGGADFEGGS